MDVEIAQRDLLMFSERIVVLIVKTHNAWQTRPFLKPRENMKHYSVPHPHCSHSAKAHLFALAT
jgi:hypothetical protein